jgi:hypothetical protein
MNHRLGRALVGLTLLAIACSPAQRRAAGGGIVGFGAVTAGLGAVFLTPCSPYRDRYEQRRCSETDRSWYEAQGLQMVGIGAGVMAFGGILYATGVKWHPLRPKPWNIPVSTGTPRAP